MSMYAFHANALRPLVARYRGDRRSEVGRAMNDLLDALLSTGPIQLADTLRFKHDGSGPALVLERNRDWDACPIRFIPVPADGLCVDEFGFESCCAPETTTTSSETTTTTDGSTTTTLASTTTLAPTTTTPHGTTTTSDGSTTTTLALCGGTAFYSCDSFGCNPVAPGCSGECPAGQACTVEIPTAHACDPGGAGILACPDSDPCEADCICLETTTTTCAEPTTTTAAETTTTTPAPTGACCNNFGPPEDCVEGVTETACIAMHGPDAIWSQDETCADISVSCGGA